MGITQEKKVVARCDDPKCTAVRYGTDDIPPVGFHITVEQIVDTDDGAQGEKRELFVCSPAHASGSLRALMGTGHGQLIDYPLPEDPDPER